MKKHINIPIFIPHLGCPNQCVFCNQRHISGTYEFSTERVKELIEESLSTCPLDAECEIAFFGGSFTGIDRALMINLLSIAKEYKDCGKVSSIRCSTRPDYISEEILDILIEYGVKTVELGLQSISPQVLATTKRGHNFADEENACRMILEKGLTLGGQMMIGLPDSTAEDEKETARFIAKSGASEARIYPTIVFSDTELYHMTQNGEYIPLSVDEAASRSAAALKILLEAGVKVLRIGLCDSENLHNDKTYYAGPNHPAMGEVVTSELYFDIISDKLSALGNLEGKSVLIYVKNGHTSKATGQKGSVRHRLISSFKLKDVKVKENSSFAPFEVGVEICERT
jgi:histone acetyltransferase (RNA polymerase elongator complex component)